MSYQLPLCTLLQFVRGCLSHIKYQGVPSCQFESYPRGVFLQEKFYKKSMCVILVSGLSELTQKYLNIGK